MILKSEKLKTFLELRQHGIGDQMETQLKILNLKTLCCRIAISAQIIHK